MYYASVHTTQQERVISGAFASALHLMFIALLVFGVTWQKKSEPQVNIVDLWSPPAPVPPKEVAPPPPPPAPPEVKPEVQPKVEPRPPPPVAKPEVAKPDIALKDKKKEQEEKERRVVEEKQKEVKKREVDAQAAQKQQQAKEAEAQQRAIREQEDAQRKLAEQAVSARQSQLEKYKKGIRDKIQRFIVKPPNLKGNEEAEFDVVMLPDGNVLGAKLKRPSGNAAYDSAVERAINRAQPLPMPPDPALLKDFRELNFTFKAQE
jgi:colicin import membrane protein